MLSNWGCGENWRSGHISPRQMRYQAALRPDCAETYGNRAFEASPKITVIRTNTETTDLAGPMATKSPAKSPADVHKTF